MLLKWYNFENKNKILLGGENCERKTNSLY